MATNPTKLLVLHCPNCLASTSESRLGVHPCAFSAKCRGENEAELLVLRAHVRYTCPNPGCGYEEIHLEPLMKPAEAA